jgi:hypothetical protein
VNDQQAAYAACAGRALAAHTTATAQQLSNCNHHHNQQLLLVYMWCLHSHSNTDSVHNRRLQPQHNLPQLPTAGL